ncbi:MAG: DNA adenine methylase [Limnochordales bacterium]
MRSIISYYGGKGRAWRHIIPHFPEHHTYVEPFGGSAAVLLNKEPSPVEVYNDIDSNVVTIFRVLRDHPDELRRALELTPYSREEYVRCLGPLDGLDDVEKARRLIVRYRQTFGGKGQQATPGQWRYSVTASGRGMASEVSRWLSTIDAVLPAVIERFRQVQIENLPWQEIVRRYDTPDTLFYCDPPYLLSTRNGHAAYQYEMTTEEHRELAEVLNSVRGHVVLSGYASPEYDEWYRGWKRVEFGAVAHAGLKRNGDKRTSRVEVLWIKPAA